VQDVFDLPLPSPPPPPAAPAPPVAMPRDAAPSAPASPPDDEPEPVAEGEPFAGLVSRAVRRRYLAALVAEGIFAFELPAERPPASAPPPLPPERVAADLEPPAEPWPSEAPFELAPEPTQPAGPVPAPEPFSPEPAFELAPPVPPAAEEPFAPSAAPETDVPASPAPRPAAEVATATLGELYLRQGHAGEAERIFGEVLRREPDNATAHEGLARARALADGAPAAGGAAPLDLRARKIQRLNGYLDRIRRGSGRHVS
jgi:hypothetical protein